MDTEAVKYFIDNIVDVPTDVCHLPINNNNSADKMGCLFSSNPIVKSFNKFKDEKDEDKDEKDDDKMADALVALQCCKWKMIVIPLAYLGIDLRR